MDRRIQRLNAEHYRAFSMALMYSVSNRTDGQLTADDLDAVPHFKAESIDALIAADLWEVFEDGWIISDYLTTQTSRAQLESAENARVKDAERKARERATKRGGSVITTPESWSPADSPADNTSEISSPADKLADGIGKASDRPWTGKVLPSVPVQTEQKERPSRKITRAFPDCSTPGCDGKLNQAAVDADADSCADCVWNGRAAS